MRVVFHHSDKRREIDLAHAWRRGVEAHGDECHLRPLGIAPPPRGHFDLACMIGVKSVDLWNSCDWADRRLMIDKGYSRHKIAGGAWEYWRISLDAHHPTRTTLMRIAMPSQRARSFGWANPAGWHSGKAIVLAGSSEKYHRFYGLPHPTDYARRLVAMLRDLCDRPIIYRPKPSWRDARPIDGTIYSPGKQPLGEILAGAHCLISHGSNAGVEATLTGTPTITLGDGVAAAIGATSLLQINDLPRPDRAQWFANLAYHQWTENEIAAGEAWAMTKRWIDAKSGI